MKTKLKSTTYTNRDYHFMPSPRNLVLLNEHIEDGELIVQEKFQNHVIFIRNEKDFVKEKKFILQDDQSLFGKNFSGGHFFFEICSL